ncbi:PH domain-containing protein [Sphingomonas glaciei]|uniref:PH domain-containing protein n=1 Tax=Sphingomonas glaciei TaxID=2938948 RepID=A0ABY5MSM0_9SPHN|nr:PH domain-containing protein [Sphingomonas glaciei]UUR06936.1 PH domain-containing protein [Sphingomonas glaciei]
MSEAALTADEAPPERLHPLALLSGIGRAVRNVVGGIAAGGFVAAQGRIGVALMIFAGIAVVTLGGLFLHWRRFSFRVGSDAIRIDSGILSRNQRTIPFDRVADVSIAQGPAQRVFGIARVTMETGGSGAGKEEGVLDGIALHRAEALREHVRTMRLGTGGVAVEAAPTDAAAVSDEAPPLFAMDLRRLLTLGLFNFSLAIFAGLFGASQTVGDALNIDPFERRFWRPILEQSGLGGWLLAHRIGLAVAGVLVLVLAGMATGVVRTVLRDFGFRLDRTGNGFRRRRGLLTRTDVSLPARRIQAGLIATGPVRDRFGWRAFKVLSLAGEGGQPGKEGRDDHVLAPLATDAEIAPIADAIRLSLPREDTPWQRVSHGHLTSFLAVAGSYILLGAVAGLLFLAALNAPAAPYAGPPAIAVAVFLLLGLLRWFEWRHTAYALEDGRLLVRTGWWSRRTLLIPLRNVQSVTLKESSLSRRFGIASLAVDIAGGRSGGQILPSLPRDQASLLHRELLSAQP